MVDRKKGAFILVALTYKKGWLLSVKIAEENLKNTFVLVIYLLAYISTRLLKVPNIGKTQW